MTVAIIKLFLRYSVISQAVLQGANTRKKGLLLESASRNRNGAKAVIKNTFSLLVFSLLYSKGFEPGSDSLLYTDFLTSQGVYVFYTENRQYTSYQGYDAKRVQYQ